AFQRQRGAVRRVQRLFRAAWDRGRQQGGRRLQEGRADRATSAARGSEAAADQGRRCRVDARRGGGAGALPACPAHVLRSLPGMDDVNEIIEQTVEAPSIPSEPAPPIESRFLLVDVAALRAKPLRSGASLRIVTEEVTLPHKAERIAIVQLRSGLVSCGVPAA